MRHIHPYENTSYGSDSLSASISILNEIDYLVPSDLRAELDLNAFLSLDPMSLLEHHKAFLRGNSMILTSALGSFSKSQIDKVNESALELVESLKSFVLSESEALPYGDLKNVMSNIDTNMDLSGVDPEKKGGFLKILHDLYLAVTEQGEPIGILHFILDIIGLVGDGVMAATGIPIGIIADLLNGIIYMVRAMNGDSDKYLLATISFIAAVIPFGGDVLKGTLKGTKAGKEAMKISTTYFKSGGNIAKGTASISDDAIKLASQASPKTIETLNYISKSSGTMVGTLRSTIAKLFDGILSTLVGWIPFIGKPLRKFFNSIGKLVRGYSKDVAKFSDDIPKIIRQADLLQLDNFFKSAAKPGAKITKKGNKLIVRNSRGEIQEVSASLLLRKNVLKDRFGGTISKSIDDTLKRADLNIADFYGSISKNSSYFSKGIYGAVKQIGTFKFIPKRSWMLFLGKEFIKMATNPDWMNKVKLTEEELEAFGIGAFTRQAKNIQKLKSSKEKDSVYVTPGFNEHINDNSGMKAINNAIDYQAKMMGLPKIETISYYNSDQVDKMPEGLKEFMEAGIDEDALPFKQMERSLSKTKRKNKRKKNKSIKESYLTHIVPFSKFIK